MNRVKYFDSLRFMAIFLVYLVHFIDYFHPEYFSFWSVLPYSLLLEGVSGKLGVALFGVLLGYFAYLSKEDHAGRYILKRYAFFVISALVINSLYAISAFIQGDKLSIVGVLVESFTLDDDIFPTYWCIPVFFVASILSYLNGKAKVPALCILLEIAIFYKLQNIWLAVCLMGNLVARYQLEPCADVLKNRIIRIVLWVVLFFAIKRPECNTTYMIDGMCCTLMIMLVMRGNLVRKILSWDWLACIGQQGMAIYILHPICYVTFGPILFRWLRFLPYGWQFAAVLVLCFGVIVLMSFPTMKLINSATGCAGKWIIKLESITWQKHIAGSTDNRK